MSRALLLLIVLQLRGWVRYLGRNLRTVRGALTALLGGGFFVLWLIAVLLSPEGVGRIEPETLRRNGPAFLLFYCLMNVFASNGERAIYFSPGEVNFLFAGPFGRREILGYKILLGLLISIPSTFIFAVIVRVHAAWLVAAYLALLLAILFQQLFGMVLNLTAAAIGARAYNRGRRLLLAAVVVLALVALLQAVGGPGRLRSRELLESITATPVWQVVSTPLRWFFEAFLAERLWPDLVQYAALALLVDVILLGIIFAMDANYLEPAAASSARIYAHLQRFRRGGLAAGGRGGTARFGIPDLPYLGGVGPLLWRQLTTASRGLGRLALALGLIGFFVVLPLLAQGDEGDNRVPGGMLAGLVVWLTVFLTQLVPFDFRGDVDRIAALKTLPLTSLRLALGQLLAPVLLVTAAQWATLAAARVLRPEDDGLLLAFACFAPPFNFLLFALENLLFLRFPTRVMAATPGDFQAVGRNLLFMFAKLAALTAVGLTAAAVGAVAGIATYLLLAISAGGLAARELQPTPVVVGAAAAWLVVTCSGLVLVPLVAGAFNAFDVSRDTPA